MTAAAAVLDAKPGEIRVFSASVTGVDGHRFEKNEDGTVKVFDLEIFKVGTFRDSMGDQATWTQTHLEQMVFHFGLLRDNGVFPNVPFRSDHSYSVDKIVGYIDALRAVNGKLVADITLTEPVAFDKFQRTTYRSRSLELGMYVTNDEEAYYPVVMGCAFVDIPAVEGLHRNGVPVRSYSFVSSSTTPKELAVPDKKDDATPTPHVFRVLGTDVTDYAQVQAFMDALVTENTGLKAQVAAADDFAKGVRDTERKAFVAGLAKDGKIAQPQVASLEALAVGLSDEQFSAFKAGYEAAPVLRMLSKHVDVTNPGGEDDKGGTDRIATLEAIVAQHRMAGMSDTDVQKTASYRELVELKAAK